ncbi:glycosyltransferase family 4 protein [Niabella terrae]
MSKSIASITPYRIVPAVTGGEKGIFLFLKYLSRYSEISCFTVTENQAAIPGITWLPVLGSTLRKLRYLDIRLFFRIRKQIKNTGIGCLIIEHPYYSWLGYLLKKSTGVRLIVHSHNIEAARFKSMQKPWWRLLHAYEKFGHRQADFSFFISKEDLDTAVNTYRLDPHKTAVITYGIEADVAPVRKEKALAKKALCDELGLSEDTRILLFNGTLDYQPNRDGLDRILTQINPFLQNTLKTPYRIIICGMRLPQVYQELKAYKERHIIYKGFVEDIGLYFKAADLFLNPITDGGGIKTKLVEALAANTPAVSFQAGAYGIPAAITGTHLALAGNGDNAGFARAILHQLQMEDTTIPAAFFEHFSWDAIARKAMAIIEALPATTGNQSTL